MASIQWQPDAIEGEHGRTPDSPNPAAATSPDSAEAPASPWPQRWQSTRAFIIKHWLPLVFAVALIIALAWPVPGRKLASVKVEGLQLIPKLMIGIVFFLSGLALQTQDLTRVRAHIAGVVFGFLSILALTPLLGFAMRAIPLQPRLFAIGLVIYCVMPTTLGVGVALVRSCKGNDAIALLLTVGTNMTAVITIPIMLRVLFVRYDLEGLDIQFSLTSLLTSLLITILAPCVAGKALRELCALARAFSDAHRVPLSMLSTALLAAIVWMTVSGSRHLLVASNAGMVFAMIALTSCGYAFYLAINWVIVTFLFHMPLPEAVAVIVMASQKSAPVAVTVISYITGDPAAQGLLAIPAIVGQLVQIFLGAAMTGPIAARVDAYLIQEAAKHAMAQQWAPDAEAGAPAVMATTQLAQRTSDGRSPNRSPRESPDGSDAGGGSRRSGSGHGVGANDGEITLASAT